jgi:hypothetical protein
VQPDDTFKLERYEKTTVSGKLTEPELAEPEKTFTDSGVRQARQRLEP